MLQYGVHYKHGLCSVDDEPHYTAYDYLCEGPNGLSINRRVYILGGRNHTQPQFEQLLDKWNRSPQWRYTPL